MSDETATDVAPKKRRRAARWIVLVGGLLGLAVPFGLELGRRLTLLSALRAESPAERKQAAWRAAETPFRAAMTVVRSRLTEGEPDAGVREALVYALGRGGDATDAQRLEDIAANDPHGYVRQSAWLALARLDGDAARAFAREVDPRDAWDQLGRNQALLMLGDTNAIRPLLDIAADGSGDQRVVATRALAKWLYPLLDAAGYWPLDLAAPEGGAFSAAEVAQLRIRVDEADIAAISADNAAHLDNGLRVRRLVSRLDNARDRVRGMLFR